MSATRRLGRPLAAAVLAASLLATLPGCDGTRVDVDAAFFVGTWHLESVRDGSGDRTAEVFSIVDEMRVTFAASNDFELLVRYTDPDNHPDRTFAGTYAVTQAGNLVLTSEGVAMAFQVNKVSDSRVELIAPAALVEGVIAGTDLDIGLTGMVTLTLARS